MVNKCLIKTKKNAKWCENTCVCNVLGRKKRKLKLEDKKKISQSDWFEAVYFWLTCRLHAQI